MSVSSYSTLTRKERYALWDRLRQLKDQYEADPSEALREELLHWWEVALGDGTTMPDEVHGEVPRYLVWDCVCYMNRHEHPWP